MTVSIGPGWSIGPGVALGGGSSTPSGPVTYTRGVEWSTGTTMAFNMTFGNPGIFSMSSGPWTDSAAYAIFAAQPIGTVFTCVATDTTTGTITTIDLWNGTGQQGTGGSGFSASSAWTLQSITFTPA